MIEVGKRLYTKDGRKVGNGIVVGKHKHSFSNLGDVWKVETDFGNMMALTNTELIEFYHLDYEPEPGPYKHSLEKWMEARRMNIGERA